MKVIYDKNKSAIPVKMWLENVEESAMKQIENLANLPFAYKHIAIMPDCHTGYGMPIGGVLATKGVVIPYAVGVDIGCGMCAVKTSLTDITQEQIKKIFGGSKDYHGGIRSAVPVGFNRHSKKQDINLMPNSDDIYTTVGYEKSILSKEFDSALKQLGTLGGGNHFIEIQQEIKNCVCLENAGMLNFTQKGKPISDCQSCNGTGKTKGNIWIMLHSGSRNLGFKVAKYYNDLAKELNKKWHTSVPKEWDLAFLPLDSKEGQSYLKEMQYCVDFAFASRKIMMERIKKIIWEEFTDTKDVDFYESTFFYKELFPEEMINIAHNYASMENHFGQNVIVHRKGATLARETTIGIIPGSQGTASYIVRGRGNQESFMSCSHGAGRTMSRTKAREKLDLETEVKKMEDRGIVHSIRSKSSLDEASSAYKDIGEVMENQKDLVEIVTELTPLGVIKG